jgi:hypothetical protein
LKDACSLLQEKSQGVKIVGGDFNEINELKDRVSGSRKNIKLNRTFINLKKENNLTDIWRQLNPDKKQFTWRRKHGTDKSRIDFWLIDSNIIPLVHSTDIRPAVINYTDHLAVSLKIKKSIKRGPGYWKFNNKHLQDKEYCDLIVNAIKRCKEFQLPNKVKWEACKYEIKVISLNYSKRKSKARNNRTQYLEHTLKCLLSEESANEAKISEIENELKEIYDSKASGALVRSRIQILEESEKCTNYFLSLEKSKQNRKTITSLKLNGRQAKTIKEILDTEVSYYEALYKSNSPPNPDSYLNDINLENRLSEEEANICEGHLTLQECSEALHSMKLNKSPGLDGLTVEFYLKFWPHLSSLVFNSFIDSFYNKELSNSQKQCIFSLLYKKGDSENLENWRPISLLNIDYKILARALAQRLQKVLPKIISLDQQGYIKNRYIGYNIRQIQDIIDYTEILDLDGVVLFLDFRKAFDTIEWEFMVKVLKKFGFKHDFLTWIKILYKNICSSVINNGWQSDFFNISCGIRQGCPLSALIFIIVAEILAIKIRSSKDIHGITVKNDNVINKLKITQLADDTTLF